jgi:hypothetical protein
MVVQARENAHHTLDVTKASTVISIENYGNCSSSSSDSPTSWLAQHAVE